MTPFTDDDLNRLKDELDEYPELRDFKVDALIARLEAAEQVCVDVGYPDHPSFLDEVPWRREHYNAWRKASGYVGRYESGIS